MINWGRRGGGPFKPRMPQDTHAHCKGQPANDTLNTGIFKYLDYQKVTSC